MVLQVFVAGGNPSADMPLRLVLLEDIPYPPVKLGVHLPQSVGYVLVYGRL